MTKVNRTINLRAGSPRVVTIETDKANQGYIGTAVANVRTQVNIFRDDGDGVFEKGVDSLVQRTTLTPGQERSLIFRTRRGETYVRFESPTDSRVKMEGEIKQLFGVNTVTLSQDPLTNPGNTPTPVPTPTPVQSVTAADPVMVVQHKFDPINVNINVSGGVDIRYSGEVDVNHIFGKIGFDSILFSQTGANCGC